MSHSRTEETALAAALKTINRVHHRENRPLVDLFPLPPHPHGSCFAAMFPVKSYVFSDILKIDHHLGAIPALARAPVGGV